MKSHPLIHSKPFKLLLTRSHINVDVCVPLSEELFGCKLWRWWWERGDPLGLIEAVEQTAVSQ